MTYFLAKTRVLPLAVALVSIGTATGGWSSAAPGIAPGCTSARPAAVGGALSGYPDGRAVNAVIGIDLANSANQKVDVDGHVTASAAYSATDRANPGLPAAGGRSGDRTWGASGTRGRLCVSAAVAHVFIEVYPKNRSGTTDKSRYGEANDQWDAVTAGSVSIHDMRLPVSHALGGNTGDLNGYITYRGHKVDPARITMRVWPADHGSACGVQGFSANWDAIGYSTSRDATYYLIRSLAGGQCGASSQQYRVFAYCYSVCGAPQRTIVRRVYIADGARPGLNFAF